MRWTIKKSLLSFTNTIVLCISWKWCLWYLYLSLRGIPQTEGVGAQYIDFGTCWLVAYKCYKMLQECLKYPHQHKPPDISAMCTLFNITSCFSLFQYASAWRTLFSNYHCHMGALTCRRPLCQQNMVTSSKVIQIVISIFPMPWSWCISNINHSALVPYSIFRVLLQKL